MRARSLAPEDSVADFNSSDPDSSCCTQDCLHTRKLGLERAGFADSYSTQDESDTSGPSLKRARSCASPQQLEENCIPMSRGGKRRHSLRDERVMLEQLNVALVQQLGQVGNALADQVMDNKHLKRNLMAAGHDEKQLSDLGEEAEVSSRRSMQSGDDEAELIAAAALARAGNDPAAAVRLLLDLAMAVC